MALDIYEPSGPRDDVGGGGSGRRRAGAGGRIPPGGCDPNSLYKEGHPCNQELGRGGGGERGADDMPCPAGQCKDTVTGQCRSFNSKREKVNMTDTWERSEGPDWAGREATSGGRGYCRKLDPSKYEGGPKPAAAASPGGGGGTTSPVTGMPTTTLAQTGNPLMDALAHLFNSRAGIFGTQNPFLSSTTSRAPGTIPTTAATVDPSGNVITPKATELEGMFLPGGGLWWGAQGDLSSSLAPFANIFAQNGGGGGDTQLPLPGGGTGGGGTPGNPAIPGCLPNVMYKVGHRCAGGTAGPWTKVPPGTGGTIPPGGCNPNVMYKVGHPCANQGILNQGNTGGGPLANALFGQGLTF